MLRVLVALALMTVAAAAQTPALTLPPATASPSAEFTGITSVRELRDGRVIVSDPRDQGLVALDMRTGTVLKIGRTGQGPGEYGMAGLVYALTGDSTLMTELLTPRWHLLSGPAIVATLGPDAPAVASGPIIGMDSIGFVLSLRSPPLRRGVTYTAPKDSVNVIRIARSTGREEVITRLGSEPAVYTTITDAAGRTSIRLVDLPAYSVGEQSVLFPDGWIAIGRLEPYRIEWRAPDGRWTYGDSLPVALTRIDAREKEAYTRQFSPQSPLFPRTWPSVIPPYMGLLALTAMPDGRLLIRRRPSAARPETQYDIVDRGGRLQGRLVLPANEAIVGFGSGAAYVVVTDSDGVQRLVRHPWPAR